MTRLLLAVAVALATLAPAARAAAPEPPPPGYAPTPAEPPAICAGNAFLDLVGTRGRDRIEAGPPAVRVWGLAGDDRLSGSPTRASCLLGDTGDDVLLLNAGGGVAFGDRGRDTVFGSGLGDVITPGEDVDAVVAGAGDDKLFARDGLAEVVDCGPGADQVKADRADVLIGCESTNLAGEELLEIPLRAQRPGPAGAVRFRVPIRRTAPAGTYRVVWLNGCRARGALEVARLGRVRAGREVPVRVARPPGGWCRPRTVRLAVLRELGRELPPVPVARLSFTVGRAPRG